MNDFFVKSKAQGSSTSDSANVGAEAISRHIDASLKNALLGYVAFDLINPPQNFQWNEYNDRPLNASHVRRLTDSFTKALQPTRTTNSISIALKKSWFSTECLQDPSGKKIEEVPLLELTEQGKAAKITPFSGFHRKSALAEYTTRMKERIEQNKTRIQELREVALATEDQRKELAALVETDRQDEDRMVHAHLWTAAVYDLGE